MAAKGISCCRDPWIPFRAVCFFPSDLPVILPVQAEFLPHNFSLALFSEAIVGRNVSSSPNNYSLEILFLDWLVHHIGLHFIRSSRIGFRD